MSQLPKILPPTAVAMLGVLAALPKHLPVLLPDNAGTQMGTADHPDSADLRRIFYHRDGLIISNTMHGLN